MLASCTLPETEVSRIGALCGPRQPVLFVRGVNEGWGGGPLVLAQGATEYRLHFPRLKVVLLAPSFSQHTLAKRTQTGDCM